MIRRGLTLIEVLVAVVILAVVSLVVYLLLREEAHQRAQALSRTAAKNEAVKILALLESDLQQARLGSFRSLDTGFSIRIHADPAAAKEATRKEQTGTDTENLELEYHYRPPTLVRIQETRQWLVSSHLPSFRVEAGRNEKTGALTGQVVVNLETAFALDGLPVGEAQTYAQEQIINMREDSARNDNPHWRDFASVANFGDVGARADLLRGLQENANLVVKPISLGADLDRIKKEAADLEGKSNDEIRKLWKEVEAAEKGLQDGKKTVNDQLSGLNDTIRDSDLNVFVDFSQVSKARPNAGLESEARQFRDYLANADSPGELEAGTVEAKGKKIFDEGMLNVDDYGKVRHDNVDNFVKGKRDLIDNRGKIEAGLSEIDKLKAGLPPKPQ